MKTVWLNYTINNLLKCFNKLYKHFNTSNAKFIIFNLSLFHFFILIVIAFYGYIFILFFLLLYYSNLNYYQNAKWQEKSTLSYHWMKSEGTGDSS